MENMQNYADICDVYLYKTNTVYAYISVHI